MKKFHYRLKPWHYLAIIIGGILGVIMYKCIYRYFQSPTNMVPSPSLVLGISNWIIIILCLPIIIIQRIYHYILKSRKNIKQKNNKNKHCQGDDSKPLKK